jgi:predicted nuclease of restriction endonuclease-like (RecB) superfamily
MAKKVTNKSVVAKNKNPITDKQLFNELTQLIEHTKTQVTMQVSSSVTLMFWEIGKKINEHVLLHKRADYGQQIVVTVSRQLTEKYGRNYEEKNLRRMLQFAEQFNVLEKVVTLSRQLSWSHFLALLPVKKQEAKLFYAEKAAMEAWSVRDLRKNIERKMYERTSIADLQLQKESIDSNSVFKDPYFLDFLGLKDTYLEADIEQAILRELESFILELGRGFAFVERQKRMIIDGEDFSLDLLFYHRGLKRLVAIELKLGKFQAKHKGQMELYLKWLNKNERREGEEPPIGLILCAESTREQIELLEMHKDGIMVAEYWTELPPKKELERKLHIALLEARERFERKNML